MEKQFCPGFFLGFFLSRFFQPGTELFDQETVDRLRGEVKVTRLRNSQR